MILCAQMDLIGIEYLAIDGCKIPSNAAKEHSVTHKEMKKKVNIQWMLYALVHNVEKLLTTDAVIQMGIG